MLKVVFGITKFCFNHFWSTVIRELIPTSDKHWQEHITCNLANFGVSKKLVSSCFGPTAPRHLHFTCPGSVCRDTENPETWISNLNPLQSLLKEMTSLLYSASVSNTEQQTSVWALQSLNDLLDKIREAATLSPFESLFKTISDSICMDSTVWFIDFIFCFNEFTVRLIPL